MDWMAQENLQRLRPCKAHGRSNRGTDKWSLRITTDTLLNKAGGQRTHRPDQAPEPGKSLDDRGATIVGTADQVEMETFAPKMY
jgi:hypothetical protein